MARRQIGKPRFYCDIPSYLKSIGKYYGLTSSGLAETNYPNEEKVYTMNPYQPNNFEGGYESHTASFRFWINQDPASGFGMQEIQDYELNKLLKYHNNSDGHHSSGWYAGILGHNFARLQSELGSEIDMCQRFWGSDGQNNANSDLYCNPSGYKQIINYEQSMENSETGSTGKPKYDGYSLWEVTSRENIDDNRFNVLEFVFTSSHPDNYWLDWLGKELKIGAFTTGIFFEPEHAFELSSTTTYSQEGIKTQTTQGGSTISNINYLGVPNWGDQPAWTLQKTDGRDYTTVANRARRQWKVGLSFIADDNMFDKAGNANKFYNDSFDDGVEDAYSVDNFDTSLSSMFKLTQMGNLPFIFCPNSTAVDSDGNDDLEFAICRITNKPSFKQVANNLFSTSLVLTETW